MLSPALQPCGPLGFFSVHRRENEIFNQPDGSGMKEAIPTVSHMALFHSGMRKGLERSLSERAST